MREDFINTIMQLCSCNGTPYKRNPKCRECKYLARGNNLCRQALEEDAIKVLGNLYDNMVHSAPKNLTKGERVIELLSKLGIPTNLLGYVYLKEAILVCWDTPAMLRTMTTVLYPKIAVDHKTRWEQVERAIRYAIEKAWNYKLSFDCPSRITFVCSPNKCKPTNTEFLSTVVEYLRLED